MRGLALLLLVLFAGAATIAAPPPANGHAVLLETVPNDGATLDGSPDQVVLRFNEPVSPIRVQVLGPGGEAVSGTEDARSEAQSLVIALPELAEGTHLVSYRVRSLDGHPVSGSLTFAVGVASPAPETASVNGREAWWRAAEGIARLFKILFVFAAAGGACYVVAVERGAAPSAPLRLAIAATAAAGIAAALLEAGFYGALLLDAAPSALADPATWRAGLAGTEGQSALMLLAGLAVIAAATAVASSALRNIMLAIGALAAFVSFMPTGHAAAVEPRWLAMPALVFHIGLAGFWAGSLAPLWLKARETAARDLAPSVERFSFVATVAVPVLIVAGIVLAWTILERTADLVASRYGWLLVAKVALVAGLLAVASINKLSLTPRLSAGDETARVRLRRNILIEICLMAVVVGVAVALAQSPPPRHAAHDHHDHSHATETPAPERYATMIESGGFRAFVSLEPARPGANFLMVRLTGADGALIEPIEITVEIANEALGIEPLRRDLDPIGAGHFALTGDEFSLPGTWQVRVDALITDFDKEIFRADIDVR